MSNCPMCITRKVHDCLKVLKEMLRDANSKLSNIEKEHHTALENSLKACRGQYRQGIADAMEEAVRARHEADRFMACLLDLKKEMETHTHDTERAVTYNWCLSRIGVSLVREEK